MKNIIDQSIFRRLTLRTVVIPLIGSIILSIIFVYIILHMLRVNNHVNHSDHVISKGHEMLQYSVDAETGMRGYALTGDLAFLEPYNNAREGMPTKISELQKLVADNPNQSATIQEIEMRYKQWLIFSDAVIDLKADNKDFKSKIMSGEGKRLTDSIRVLFKRFIETEVVLRDKRIADTRETVVIALFVIIGCALLGGLFLALFTRNQLKTLSESYSKIIHKQSEQALILEGKEWIQSGKAGLMDQLRGDLSVEELSSRILSYICNRINGKVAALYNMEYGTLRRSGSYAFSAESLFKDQKLKIGEGLIGQVAVDKKLKVLKNLPSDYINVSSSLGSAKAANIILIPLMTDNEVKGVIEIGFFSEIPDHVVEFLEGCSENLAIAIKSAEYKSMLRELLEESQRQTEELQTQQEELQANNEELEEQTNALKESQSALETQQSELEQTNRQLSKQSLELEQQSEAVNLKNEELQKAQNSLEIKARELEAASIYKSQFLANMSHELRTPLNSSLILSQLLMEDKRKVLGPEEKEFVSTIYSSSNDLLTLINDILDLSKVEAGKIELHPEKIEINDLVQGLERMFKPMAATKKIEFISEIMGDSPDTVMLDRQRVDQILKNLISNALKFTEKGNVKIKINRASNGKDSERIEFSIIDTGIGIAPEQLQIIFDAFKQADGTTSRKYGGTGLGLTISKDLARLLGGDIFVSSEPGKGSTFTLNLPINQLQIQNKAASTMAPSRVNVPPTEIYTPKKEAIKQVATLPLPFEDDRKAITESTESNIRILLVIEDDTNFAKILFDLSHEMKFKCLIAQTAEEGIRTAEDFLPQAIILDMHLPDRSGLTVIDHLKNNPRTRHIPIHIVSAQDQTNIAMQMGAIGYLKKPVSLVDVRAAMSKIEEKLAHTLKRVLVVEDNKVQRESIKELIKDNMVEVIMAENATAALKSLKEFDIDCMILDLHLPGMDGYELLQKMTEIDDISHPPVIVYTGKDLSKAEEQNLQKYSQSIIIKGAHSPERLFSEVTLFLHQIEDQLSKDRQTMLQKLRNREKIFEGKVILLVDDDVRNIFALSAALESKGAVIETARNGLEAVEKVKSMTNLDLVLMDIMMPEMDGFEATREIRKDPRFRKLPIIAVTAKAMADDQERCREAGANDYLAKPVDLQKLLSLLRVWMPHNGRV